MATKNVDSIRVSFPIRISALAVVLTIILDVLFFTFSGELDETLLFVSASAAAAGTILAAFYSARVLAHQVVQNEAATIQCQSELSYNKKKAAFEFTARWTSPHMQEARQTCRQIADMKGQSVSTVKEIIDTAEETSDVFHLLNFFEEMAMLIKYDVADAEILKDNFSEPLKAIWLSLHLWMVDYKNANGLTMAWSEMECLHNEWSSQ